MKKLTAVKFRFILIALLVLTAAAGVASFVFGYQHLQAASEDAQKRQADATASEDSINNLQRLQRELQAQSDVAEKLATLKSSSTLPQFDTERTLRTITDQLGLSIENVTFVDSNTTTPTATSSSSTSTTSSTSTWSGDRNSVISFEFSDTVSYEQLITFLDAIETSIPKVRVLGITIPAGSSQASIDPGVITLEMATS